MERYFLFNNLNTWLNWNCYLTGKNIADPTPNTNYVKLDGVNGTLDLSESLTGEITYADRIITATFWTDYGTRKEREALLRKITAYLHGKKFKIIEPDDTDHYLYGRVKITAKTNNLAYATFTIEATCEPWRYANEEIVRKIDSSYDGEYVPSAIQKIIITNNGVKTLCPKITVVGEVEIGYKGSKIQLSTGTYIVPEIKLQQGTNELTVVSFDGSVTFTYKEATL